MVRNLVKSVGLGMLIFVLLGSVAYGSAWEKAGMARVTAEDAVQSVLADHGGTVLEIELEVVAGTLVYEVEILEGQDVREFIVNAMDGSVTAGDDEDAEDEDMDGEEDEEDLYDEEDEDKVDLDDVRAANLLPMDRVLKAAASQNNGRFVALWLEHEEDEWVYEAVYALENGKWEEVEVNAETAEFIEVEIDDGDDDHDDDEDDDDNDDND